MSTSKLIREETGEIVPWDSLTKQEKLDLWDNVWSKRIARVVAEYIHNHPEERKQVIDALDWAPVEVRRRCRRNRIITRRKSGRKDKHDGNPEETH